jgi:hypothetical protein
MDDLLPTVLAAGGTAAEFCSQPEIWPLFEKWLYGDRRPDGEVTQDFMSLTATISLLLVQGIEREMLAGQAAEFLATRTG